MSSNVNNPPNNKQSTNQSSQQIPILTYTNQSPESVIAFFNSSLANGLSTTQAQERLTTYGLNQLPETMVSWKHMLWRQLSSLFTLLFLAILVISFFVGEYFNAGVLLLLITINVSVGFYQEYHATQALQLLKKFLVAYVQVLRDGKQVELETTHLVPGDILLLQAGDKIAADVRIIQQENLLVDESILTGESRPVTKQVAESSTQATSLFDAVNCGFAGTAVTSGKAVGLVCATGQRTAFGGIAQSVTQTHTDSTLVRGTQQLSSFIVKLVLITLVIVFCANLILKGHQSSVLELFIFSLALAVTAIPEALPIVVTFSLARGVGKLAQQKVVVKRLAAVEDLGEIEILCTDKTGTLTENTMSVVAVYGADRSRIMHYAACIGSYTFKHSEDLQKKDFNGAVWAELSPDERQKIVAISKVDEIPFDAERRRNVVLIPADTGYELVVRGATIEVLERCVPLPVGELEPLQAWITQQGNQGNRVLAVGIKTLIHKPEHLVEEETALTFIGCISFADPLKPTALEAVYRAKKLGIEIRVISGDTVEVCAAVGKQVGLITDRSQVVTGQQMAVVFGQELTALIKQSIMFARVTPEQKLLIIKTLQQDRIVGYMGDGINDAPALKGANVSLAVYNAAAIVRDSADIILLKKSLMVIIDGIQEGRKIVTNIMKYLKITLSGNFGNFYSVAIASLVLPYVPMLPLHILLINLLCDFPMIAISTDTVDPVALKKPRSYTIKNVIWVALIFGVLNSCFDFIFFFFFINMPPGVLQTGWFLENVLTQLAFIFAIRSYQPFYKAPRPSWLLLFLAIFTGVVATLLPLSSFGQTYMQFTALSPYHLFVIGGITVGYFVSTEVVKYYYHRIVGHFA